MDCGCAVSDVFMAGIIGGIVVAALGGALVVLLTGGAPKGWRL
jgi:hypothetical protein